MNIPVSNKRPIEIRGLQDATIVLKGADESLTLTTPPQASAYLGPGYVKALTAELARSFPETFDKLIYDCGTRTGDALAAIRCGLTYIAVEKTPALPALIAYAAAHGAVIVDSSNR